jgi:uroporphyrinogen III methyltransferase/synthase
MREQKNSKTGKAYLVGAGPGEAKLITLKGVECLRRADVVIYDRLVNVKLLEYCPPHAEIIYKGKEPGEREARQTEINDLMIQRAKAGQTVIRLKGGDPFVFGHGGEEALILREADVEFEIVPGVTSAIAVPAYAGVPVTHRGYSSSFVVATGHSTALGPDSEIRWDALGAVDTLIVLMGVGHLRELAERLIKYGRSPETPTILVRWGTTPRQETLEGTLADIADKAEAIGFESPAIIIVGKVNALREQLRWYDCKPLFGRRIVITRPRAQADEFIELLESHGAEAILFPTIELQPISDTAALDKAIESLFTYNWVVFTSVNAVEYFYRRLRMLGKDARAFGDAKICAVGPKTAEALSQIGLNADDIPSQSRGAAIAAELKDVAGRKILLPRARIGADDLPNGLREREAIVDDIPIYDTARASGEGREAIAERLRKHAIDMVTFLSSSAATNFVDMFDVSTLSDVHIAVIGPSTAETVKQYGLRADVVAKQPSIEGLVEEIVGFYEAQK